MQEYFFDFYRADCAVHVRTINYSINYCTTLDYGLICGSLLILAWKEYSSVCNSGSMHACTVNTFINPHNFGNLLLSLPI